MQKYSNLFIQLISLILLTLTTLNVYSEPQLEEVVVEARKRVENLQETPVSVLTFSEQAMESQNIGNIIQLSEKLPSVHIGTAGGIGNNAAFYIRGLGSGRNAINQESAVALYIDDFYYGRSDGALLSVIGAENIEVLRGPQGTLFGRNASAGVIRYVTKKPELGESSYKLKMDFGTDAKKNVSASANIPIGEQSALRLLAGTVNQDGYVENALGQDLGDQGTNVFRASFRSELSDSMELLLSGNYTDTDRNGAVTTAFSSVSADDIPGALVSGDEDRSTSDLYAEDKNKAISLGATLNWDMTETVALKLVTSYQTLDSEGSTDFDGTGGPTQRVPNPGGRPPVLIVVPGPRFDIAGLDRETDSYSVELQLSGGSDYLNWITGMFYYVEESQDFRFQGASIRNNYKHDLESIGVFGQTTVAFNDYFSLTAGLRYTEDDKEIGVREASCTAATFNVDDCTFITFGSSTNVENKDSWGSVSGKISLEYRANDDLFLFASYARGYRSGGLNDRPLTRGGTAANNFGVVPFDEETLDVYEVGLRSEWLDNRLRLNVTYFLQEMEDLQYAFVVDTLTAARAVGNAAAAESKGLEAEVTWLATDALSFDATFGLLDAEFKSAEPSTNIQVGDGMSQSPDLKFNVGANYTIDLGDGDLDFRVDYSHVDDQWSTATRATRLIQESYELLGFNISYAPGHGNWKASVYGTNTTDERYYNFGGHNLAPVGVIFRGAAPSRGAVFGLKAEYNF